MSRRSYVQVNHLSHAARQLQLRPPFTTVNHEDVQGPLTPLLYEKHWLHIIPYFPGRNRWRASGRDRATISDVTLIDARARNDMRSIAIREADYRLALQRLRDSQPHERALNENLASLHRGEYLVERGLLFVRLVTREIRSLSDWFVSTPDFTFSRDVEELHGQIVADLLDLQNAVSALGTVSRVRLNELLGADTVQHAVAMYRLEGHRRREYEKRYALLKSVRLVWKQTRAAGDFSKAAMDEQREFFAYTDSSGMGDEVDELRLHEESQKTLALSRAPARWVSTSFSTYFEQIVQHQWASLRSKLYIATKFPKRDDMSPSQTQKRQEAYETFRRLLVEEEFELPRPYGVEGQDVSTLARELQWIREYRIEKFPDSVKSEEIQLARGFHRHMRKQLFGRAFSIHNRRWWAGQREFDKLTRDPDHGTGERRNRDSFAGESGAEDLGDGGSGTPDSRRASSIENFDPLAADARPHRQAPALVMAFQAFQGSHTFPGPPKKTEERVSPSSVSEERKVEPQPAVSQTKQPAARAQYTARELESILAGQTRSKPPKMKAKSISKMNYKSSHKPASKVAGTKTVVATAPSKTKAFSKAKSAAPKAKKMSVGTRLASILHARNSAADAQR